MYEFLAVRLNLRARSDLELYSIYTHPKFELVHDRELPCAHNSSSNAYPAFHFRIPKAKWKDFGQALADHYNSPVLITKLTGWKAQPEIFQPSTTRFGQPR